MAREYASVSGVWLRKVGQQVQVLVELADGWHLIIEEHEDGPFSHIYEGGHFEEAPRG